VIQDCYKHQSCTYCRKNGHVIQDCHQRLRAQGVCFLCRQSGHMARECPTRIIPDPCRFCGQTGHDIRVCPQRLGNMQNHDNVTGSGNG
jgi:hypothetical protein